MPDLFKKIPAARALGIRINRFENGQVELVAPFRPNSNDKGTAFAGSMASMLTLAGWAAITLCLQEAGVEAEVMVVKSETEYAAPARAALFAETTVSEAEQERIARTLEENGRSRITLETHLHSEGITCARMTASYAIIATKA